MKKVLKLTAVLTASLILAMSFIACSDNDDDESDSSALQGLWLDDEGAGYYFNGNMIYPAVTVLDKGYYFKDMGMECSVSEKEITITVDGEKIPVSYTLSGDTVKADFGDGLVTLKKSSATLTATTEKELSKLFG